MQGERLELHCCEVDTLPLSLALFINLFHPRRASSDPHSSRGEGGCLSSIIDATASHEPRSPEPSLRRSHKGQKTTGRHLASHPHSRSEENYASARRWILKSIWTQKPRRTPFLSAGGIYCCFSQIPARTHRSVDCCPRRLVASQQLPS